MLLTALLSHVIWVIWKLRDLDGKKGRSKKRCGEDDLGLTANLVSVSRNNLIRTV